MALPAKNPIDVGWFTRGTPIDFHGVVTRDCPVCEKKTQMGAFRVALGTKVNFGSPVFIRPFLKHTSTAGKIGGVKGELLLCHTCDGLWPSDLSGSQVLRAMGLNPDGVASPSYANDLRNRRAAEAERKNEESSTAGLSPDSKIRKIED